MEKWKDIEGYEGLYQVSNTGKIKSLKNNIIMKQTDDKDGYKKIVLSNNGSRGYYRVHRLVARSFIHNNGFPFVNHKNGIKHDNCVDNLEWCTQSHNERHAYDTGLKCTKLKAQDVLKIRELYNTGNYTMRFLANKFNTAYSHVNSIIHRRKWRHI